MENLTETCGLNAQEIAILLARVSRVKDFIKHALKKAEAYDRVVVPLMESRKKATKGHWWASPTGIDVGGEESVFGLGMTIDNMLFICHAANLISKELKGGE